MQGRSVTHYICPHLFMPLQCPQRKGRSTDRDEHRPKRLLSYLFAGVSAGRCPLPYQWATTPHSRRVPSLSCWIRVSADISCCNVIGASLRHCRYVLFPSSGWPIFIFRRPTQGAAATITSHEVKIRKFLAHERSQRSVLPWLLGAAAYCLLPTCIAQHSDYVAS